MGRRGFVACIGLWCGLSIGLGLAVPARGQTRGQPQETGGRKPAVDWILLVDTSASMRGVGGTKDIWDDVKGSIATFVEETADGDTVSLYTFDRDVRFLDSQSIRGRRERDALTKRIHKLDANGKLTHLGAAIEQGFDRAKELRPPNDKAKGPGSSRERAIVLFTDGKQDVRGIRNPVPVDAGLTRLDESNPWIFLVSMGDHEEQLDAYGKKSDRARILKPHDSVAIQRAVEKIRETIDEPPPPPPAPVITVSPSAFWFGDVARGSSSGEQELSIETNLATTVAVRLVEKAGVTMASHDVKVTPESPARVKLQLAVADDATVGQHALRVRVGDSAIVTANVGVIAPSWLERSLKWLVALAILLLLASIATMLITGKGPNDWFAALVDRNRLEGELEIIEPHTSAETAFVGLPALRANEIALSSIVPADALGGADARLYCRRQSGEKKVWIAANAGELRVNEVEVPASELFDADTIQIGAARLRFNRVGHNRPQEDRS